MTTEWNFPKQASPTPIADSGGWDIGSNGKGWLTPDNRLITWATGKGGNPSHMDMMSYDMDVIPEYDSHLWGQQPTDAMKSGYWPISIQPDGKSYHAWASNSQFPEDIRERIHTLDPRLNFSQRFVAKQVRDVLLGDNPENPGELEPDEVLDSRDAAMEWQPPGMAVGHFIKVLVSSDPVASRAAQALAKAGGTPYVVGGAVRDALRGQIPDDIDMMVSGLEPSVVNQTLRKLPGQVNEVGARFGVFRYKERGYPGDIQIALPRTDVYETGRRGEGRIKVDPNLPIDQDLLRRDFTCNSMAVDLTSGELHDPYHGTRDIESGILRTTHPDSFKEDPTRLIRALTAHGRFGLVPDERTRHEMEENGYLLRGESPDALQGVLDKLFKSSNPASAIRLAHDTGILRHLFPELDDNWSYSQQNKHHTLPLGEHQLQALDHVSRLTTDPDVRLATLLHDTAKPASAWIDPDTGENHYYQNEQGQGANHEVLGAQMAADRLRALHYPNDRIKRVSDLINLHMFPGFDGPKGARKFLQRTGPHADDLLNMREADWVAHGTERSQGASDQVNMMRQQVENARAAQAPTNLSTLNVNGTDLLNMGLRPGKAIGDVLNALMDKVISEPGLNDRATLLGMAKELVSQQAPEAFV